MKKDQLIKKLAADYFSVIEKSDKNISDLVKGKKGDEPVPVDLDVFFSTQEILQDLGCDPCPFHDKETFMHKYKELIE